jgi:predicted nucleotide-binding protein
MSAVAQKISDLIDVGWNVRNWETYETWRRRVQAFLERGLPAEADKFEKTRVDLAGSDWEVMRASQIGMLEGLAVVVLEESAAVDSLTAAAALRVSSPLHYSKRVFVVHGHNNETKESVARFVEQLGLEAIILHEQPSSGGTVIEKLERYADVGFAVVLLTPDDVGAAASERDQLKPRARQNVILELGYFIGRLSRRRVCALYKKGVEIPSDYQGVVFIELDPAGAWHVKLAQELSEAGVPISLESLFKKV